MAIPGAATGLSTASANSAASPLQPFFNSIPADVATSPRAIIDSRLGGLSGFKILGYPHDLPKYYMQMILSDFNRTATPVSRVDIIPLGAIRLPLPQGLVDNHVVEYEEEPFNAAQKALINITDINAIRNML